MDTVYLIMIEEGPNSIDIKGYSSFSRLCSEAGIKKGMLNKKDLPVKLGNRTILTIKVDNKI
jgi:hypothetical protein